MMIAEFFCIDGPVQCFDGFAPIQVHENIIVCICKLDLDHLPTLGFRILIINIHFLRLWRGKTCSVGVFDVRFVFDDSTAEGLLVFFSVEFGFDVLVA
jgi:hypothetical protein